MDERGFEPPASSLRTSFESHWQNGVVLQALTTVPQPGNLTSHYIFMTALFNSGHLLQKNFPSTTSARQICV